MSKYELYATRWDDPHLIEELIPARGLEFTMPLNDHGECSFSASVEPGRSFWRRSIAPIVSGVLVCRDDVPVWSGFVWSERQSGPRTFDFTGAEWGSFFERCPAVPHTYSGQNDHAIFRDVITRVQAVSGQDVKIQMGSTTGRASSDLTINEWDNRTAEDVFRSLGDAQGGPEWYFGTAGTMTDPKRVLVLSDRMGRTDPIEALEYVESTEEYVAPAAPPTMTLLGNLFPGQEPQALIGGRRGGNVIAHPARQRDGSSSATAVVAVGSGSEDAQLRATAQASTLLNAGYPRMTLTNTYEDVSRIDTLRRHADLDLAQRAGLLTSYTLTTWDDNPDWTQVQRGDTVRVIIDSDVYAGPRPLDFTARVLSVAVQVQDTGPAQVNWTIASPLEVA